MFWLSRAVSCLSGPSQYVEGTGRHGETRTPPRPAFTGPDATRRDRTFRVSGATRVQPRRVSGAGRGCFLPEPWEGRAS